MKSKNQKKGEKMLAIEESQKLTLSNLSSLNLFTGTDQGQFEVMKSQVLKQIGYDPADLNFAYLADNETTRRTKLTAPSEARGRAAAHRHTQRPGPPTPRNTRGATATRVVSYNPTSRHAQEGIRRPRPADAGRGQQKMC